MELYLYYISHILLSLLNFFVKTALVIMLYQVWMKKL